MRGSRDVAGQWASATWRFGIAGPDSVPQHVVRLIKETELDGGPKGANPFRGIQADGAVFDLESPPEGRLPGAGEATDDHEPPGLLDRLLDPVGLGCLDEANRAHTRRSLEPGLGDPVPPVHEMAVSGEDDRIVQVRRVDERGMLRDGTTGRWSVSEPAIPVEVGDVGDLDALDRELARQAPQALGPPERSSVVCE